MKVPTFISISPPNEYYRQAARGHKWGLDDQHWTLTAAQRELLEQGISGNLMRQMSASLTGSLHQRNLPWPPYLVKHSSGSLVHFPTVFYSSIYCLILTCCLNCPSPPEHNSMRSGTYVSLSPHNPHPDQSIHHTDASWASKGCSALRTLWLRGTDLALGW
jgi:hypothetical protein